MHKYQRISSVIAVLIPKTNSFSNLAVVVHRMGEIIHIYDKMHLVPMLMSQMGAK